ncbi:MAG: homoserine kinase [Trueperaceae bacterium]|nr:homoserine kinase [Trueperaceae bacterium]
MFEVFVPATSANLGPGFDCLGLAIDLCLEVKAELSVEDHFYYRGAGQLDDKPGNLMHEGFRAAYHFLSKQAPRVSFFVNNPIPLARGLGSSSAALVAGIALADAFLEGVLGRDGIFQLSASLEGHPDNVAPAIFGGFTASVYDGRTYLCEALELPSDWQLLFGVPAFELLTSEARNVLPQVYKRADVIYNTSRAALWSLAVIKNKPELLRLASQDKIHEPYREPLVPKLSETKEKLLEAGAYAAFLSGAGPTLGVICSKESVQSCHKLLTDFVGSGYVLQTQASAGFRLNSLVQG